MSLFIFASEQLALIFYFSLVEITASIGSFLYPLSWIIPLLLFIIAPLRQLVKQWVSIFRFIYLIPIFCGSVSSGQSITVSLCVSLSI